MKIVDTNVLLYTVNRLPSGNNHGVVGGSGAAYADAVELSD